MDIFFGLKIIVNTTQDTNRKYTTHIRCDEENQFLSIFCRAIKNLCEDTPELSAYKTQLHRYHRHAKRLLGYEAFGLHQNTVFAEWFYNDDDQKNGLFVRVEQCLVDANDEPSINHKNGRIRNFTMTTNWGAELRGAARRVSSVCDLSYFEFLEEKGAQITLPSKLKPDNQIVGAWEFAVAGLMLRAMSIEGYINFLGNKLFPQDWASEIERLSMFHYPKPGEEKKTRKIEKIYNRISTPYDENSEPISVVKQLFELRNEFAHPKFDEADSYLREIVDDIKDFSTATSKPPVISRFEQKKAQALELVTILDSHQENFLKTTWNAANKVIDNLPKYETQMCDSGVITHF